MNHCSERTVNGRSVYFYNTYIKVAQAYLNFDVQSVVVKQQQRNKKANKQRKTEK